MSESGRLGVVVVEDEERARRTARDLLAADPDLRLLSETWGPRAPAVIQRLRPDIILLDVQMPEMNGFEVLRNVPEDRRPVIVFVTAYDEYALRAFDAAAVDYLLKPFSDDRFFAAMARAKEQARSRRHEPHRLVARLTRLLELADARGPERLTIGDGSRTLFVDPGDLDWIEADGVYARLHFPRRKVLVRQSLTALEARLDPFGFFRIHRSAIVNIARVVEIRHRSHGDYAVRLRDGTELTLARTRKGQLEEVMRARNASSP